MNGSKRGPRSAVWRLGPANVLAGPGCALLLAVSGLTLSPPAQAQHGVAETERAPLSDALSGEAKREYERGRELYNAGDAGAAFSAFQRAHDLIGDPRLLWNMGACAKAQQHFARAHVLVTAYLREAGATISAETRARAEDTARALRGMFSVLELRGAPLGARVRLDGEDAGRVPVPDLALDLGAHTLRLEHEAFEPFEVQVDVKGAGHLAVDVVMRRIATKARLLVEAEPGATIRVDASEAALGRWQGDIAPGAHALTVSAKGKRTAHSTVELDPGSNKTMRITLQDEPSIGIWPWIAAGAAVSAAAVVGGYFLFRPSAEPGAAPQGGLGTFSVPPAAP